MLAGPPCKKVAVREYYTENNCRSRKPLKMAKCEGGCGTSCCRARKTKKRKVRLICNDGTRYTKDIEIIRKCACAKKCYWLPGPSMDMPRPVAPTPSQPPPPSTPSPPTQEVIVVLPHVSRGATDGARRRRTRPGDGRRQQLRVWTDDVFSYATVYAAVSVTVELLIIVIWSISVCIYLLLP